MQGRTTSVLFFNCRHGERGRPTRLQATELGARAPAPGEITGYCLQLAEIRIQ
jgi:hypothetical protein